jgi:DNA-binding NarL/FixJ family response regulator
VTDHRILIVDDFEKFRGFVSALLQQSDGFQVSEASDGFTAVQKAEELQPDLVLLDIGLPGLNGLEVARRIRSLVPSAKVLFLSQQSDLDVVKEALNLGMGYVHKNNLASDLLSAVDSVLCGERFVSGGLLRRLTGTDARTHSGAPSILGHSD